MEYSLIANSGIQLLTSEFTIDLNSKSRHFFHEWFDEEEVQTNLEFAYQLKEFEKVVRMADLEKYRFINSVGL